MKAVVYHKCGSPNVLRLQDVDKLLVKNSEALV